MWSRLGSKFTVVEFLNTIGGGVGIDEEFSYVPFILRRFEPWHVMATQKAISIVVDEAKPHVQAEHKDSLQRRRMESDGEVRGFQIVCRVQ